jgi:SAM-dependent methyltransferase
MLQSRVLDVGSGTGIWSNAIADRFHLDVVGVEPGAGMRSVAAERRHPLVTYLAGSAAALPLADCTATAAWLSTVVHHFPDLDGAAAELRRVLATPAPLLIRNWFADRFDGIEATEHFPSVGERLSGWRTVGEVVDVLERHDFGFAGLERVETPGLDDYDQVLAAMPQQRHSDSLLSDLDDDEWEAGLASIRRARDRGERPRPLGLDLLVFH